MCYSTWLISFQCKLYATPIEFHIKRSLSIWGFYLSSPFVFYSFVLADNPCFLYVHLSVLLDHCYCITLIRAFYPCTGIYMFIPFFSLFKNTKTFSNCNICLFTSLKAIIQIILFFHFWYQLSIPEPYKIPIKRDFRFNQISLDQIDHGTIFRWPCISKFC